MANKWQIRMNSFNQRIVDRFVEEKAENIPEQFNFHHKSSRMFLIGHWHILHRLFAEEKTDIVERIT